MSEYRKSIIYCVIFCLTLAALGSYDIYSVYLKEKENTHLRVTNNSFLIGEWIKGAFNASDLVLRDIIGDVPLAEVIYPDPDPVRQARITQHLSAKLKTLPFAVGVGLSDKNCIITHTWNIPPRSSPIGFDGSQREWCKLPKADPKLETFVTNAYLNNSNRIGVNQFRRYPGDTNELNGLAGIGVDLDFFSQWIEQINITQNSVIAIADSQLTLLARKPSLPELLGKKVHVPLIKDFIDSGENHKIFWGASPLDGEDRLYSIRKIEGLPFVIIVGEADADWLAGLWHRAWTITLLLITLWGMALLTLHKHWRLLRQKEELVQLANTDALTGIANRRSFIDSAKRQLIRNRRHASGLVVLVLDIDRFKLINDIHGHAVGDRAIIKFSKACQAALRDIDFLGRLGGDEFAVLLTDVAPENAKIVAERIRESIETAELMGDKGERIPMTASIGAAIITAELPNIEAALAKADIALYKSKQQGRNRVEFAD